MQSFSKHLLSTYYAARTGLSVGSIKAKASALKCSQNHELA